MVEPDFQETTALAEISSGTNTSNCVYNSIELTQAGPLFFFSPNPGCQIKPLNLFLIHLPKLKK